MGAVAARAMTEALLSMRSVYYNNSDNDIAWGETGVLQTWEQSCEDARAHRTVPDLQTGTTLRPTVGGSPELFLNELLIILLFERKSSKGDKWARRTQHF